VTDFRTGLVAEGLICGEVGSHDLDAVVTDHAFTRVDLDTLVAAAAALGKLSSCTV
jgi:hypothetical protein